MRGRPQPVDRVRQAEAALEQLAELAERPRLPDLLQHAPEVLAHVVGGGGGGGSGVEDAARDPLRHLPRGCHGVVGVPGYERLGRERVALVVVAARGPVEQR